WKARSSDVTRFGFALWKKSVEYFIAKGGFRDDGFVLGGCNGASAAGPVRPYEASQASVAWIVLGLRVRPHAVRFHGAQRRVLHIRWRRARGQARRALLHGLP